MSDSTSSTRNKIILWNTVQINPKTKVIVAAFATTDATKHNLISAQLQKDGFTAFSLGERDLTVVLGSKVAISMDCNQPDGWKVNPASSLHFTVDEGFLEHWIYFTLDAEPSNTCEMIGLSYKCSVDGVECHTAPLRMQWPPQDSGDPAAVTNKAQGVRAQDHAVMNIEGGIHAYAGVTGAKR